MFQKANSCIRSLRRERRYCPVVRLMGDEVGLKEIGVEKRIEGLQGG